ncbi:MAG TPA: ATP-binding protein [Bacteroidota bacterium]|jgi:two-component system sensor kinase|nr:ATP-binding protein [Bacteroidota bacterium]
MRASISTDDELEEQYKSSLRSYLIRRDEESLFQAYELSRQMLASGSGVMEILDHHQRMLAPLLPGLPRPVDIERVLQNSHDFFCEILSPFEMIHRGFRETSATLVNNQIQRAELEHCVQQRTVQLQDANKELEAFSYSVAHDLRAPLRAIDGFTRVLLEDNATQLNEEGKHFLNLTRVSIRKMGELITDLLTFSRFSRNNHKALSTIDMKPFVQEIADELLKHESNRSIDIRIHDLPSIRGSAPMLRQVLINLISNAIKFTRDRSEPVIEIGSETREDGVVFHVKDNGAGFEMRYAHKLFNLFQRLHSTGSYEGTGVGLAIVQRIIHRHGGRVWAEGEVDKGAAFYFTLPTNGAP